MRLWLVPAALAATFVSSQVFADSVAQVATAKRISRQTVTLIDPQGQPAPGGVGDTLIKVGDILTFVIQFTPVPNGAYRGLGGYITDYVPSNTEVVGVRFIDGAGNTVAPHRGGLASDGVGPRGPGGYANPLTDGSLSQLYADTGVFYSTDPRTARAPTGAAAGEAFLSLNNGLQMSPAPTAANQLANILNSGPNFYAHNLWDLTQVYGFGTGGGGIGGGNGNTPEQIGSAGIGYGSFVAGPNTWYQLEATHNAALGALAPSTVKAMSNVGPWQRIRTFGGEIGRRGTGTNPPTAGQTMPNPGLPARVGIRALDNTGALLGRDLSAASPLPAGTNAVRFALGELVVGDEYFAEISLRVKALPMDPVSGLNLNCAEVTGGDASSRAQDGKTGGKDHTWRYFLPAPSCVLMTLLFENRVDKVLAVSGTQLNYTIEGKNLATVAQANVQVRDCFQAGDVTLVPAGTTPGYVLDTTGAGCPDPANEDAIVWTVGAWPPGASFTFNARYTATRTTTNRAVYTSTALPTPGFTATAFTTIASLPVLRLALGVTPDYVPALPGTVRYTATLANIGSGPTSFNGCTGVGCYVEMQLPSPFAPVTGSTRINGTLIAANPTVIGSTVRFTAAQLATAGVTALAAGATLTIAADVTVPVGTVPGVHRAGLVSWTRGPQDFEDAIFNTAPLAVLSARSDTPTIASPILQGATTIAGKTTEATGSTVTVYLNGNPVASGTTSAGGNYGVVVPPLFAGQRVTTTITAAGEVESYPSNVEIVVGVVGVAACSDGIDNDGDGKIDFPADPGCSSPTDVDETDVPQCSDGIDNDGDGKIDFPADEGCSSYLDALESGPPACSDGIDNDGDGKIDFPADPGCTSANDVSEAKIAACSDGIDNDGDGKIDFPADPGCSSALDDVENDVTGPDAGADGGGNGGSSGAIGDGGSSGTTGREGGPPDPGGVPDASEDGPGEGGCSCRTVGPRTSNDWGATLVGAAFLVLRSRRRRDNDGGRGTLE